MHIERLLGTESRMMLSFKRQVILFAACFTVLALENVTCSPDDCYQYRRRGNVTMDTDQCLWENYTEPESKRFCLDACFENAMVR